MKNWTLALRCLKEILTDSILEDEKRLQEILNEVRSKSQMQAHEFRPSRPLSAGPPPIFRTLRYFNDITAGIDYYPVCGAVGTGV